MKKKWIVLLTLAVVAGVVAVGALYRPAAGQTVDIQQQGDNPLRTISVSGNGQASTRPDVAVAIVGVNTDADTAQNALSQNNQQMNSLLNALQDAGIAADDIQTQSIQLYPRYGNQTNPNGTQDLVGYTASNTVEVRVRELDQLGEVLDSAVSAGGNTIQGVRFEVSNPSDLYNQALENAMNDARSKAEQLASLAGAELGPVISISEGASGPIPYAMESAVGGGQAVPIAPGTQSLSMNIQVTWQLGSSDFIPATGGTQQPTQATTPQVTETVTSTQAITSTTSVPPAAAIAAQQMLAAQLDTTTAQVEIVDSTQVNWANSCLELGQPNESCLTVITPGWKITLQHNGETYVAHTDALGEQVRWE